jgi:hypothetical protein
MELFVNNALLESTFFIKIGNSTGSAFTLTKDKKQYLVSARHIVENYTGGESITIELFHEKQWKKLDVRLFMHDNMNIDIVVFELPDFIAPAYDFTTGSKIVFGQDLFFLGFPYGLHSDSDLNRSFPFAFIKKATFSCVYNDPKIGTIFFLDGHNNKGFSGGPVGYYDNKTKQTHLIAVISGYIPDKNEINSPIGKLSYSENSGIILTFDVKHAFEILNKIK